MNILNKKFWVVTKASKISTLADICFTTDFEGLHIQYKGGLNHEDIVGIYIDEAEAERKARKILSAFDEPQTITVNSYVRTTDEVIDPTGDSDLKIPKGALCKITEICNPEDWWGEFQLIVEHNGYCFALEAGEYELATDIIQIN
jgi:hypothetical protein